MATEASLRKSVANYLVQYIGIKEGSDEHKALLAVFNDSKLCTRYTMTVNDAWCATAVSAAFIACGLTSIFPCVECSCAKMIELADANGIWKEDDGYTPEIGDVIMYDWQDTTGSNSDNTGAPDHVGIVTAINGTAITVIEGNKSDTVGYRSMTVNGKYIRGYILPDYASKATSTTSANKTTVTTTTSSTLKAGTKVTLSKAKLYASETASSAAATKTGTYYIWDATVKNGRIRITNKSANVGKSGQVTGWVATSDCTIASSSSSASTTTAAASTTTAASGSSKPSYTVGKTYTLQVDKLTVRTGAGTNYAAVSYANLTDSGKKHAYSNGTLKKGTTVTCKATKTVGSDIWMKIPSGWIAAYYNSKVYVK